MNQPRNPNRPDESFGLVFNMQKFSLHDGEGIRTLIFLKGCPLTCDWCSNPEGQSCSPELAYIADKCIGKSECERCMNVCETGAIRMGDDGKAQIDRSLCNNCGECVQECPSRALELFGKYMSIDDVITVVEEDSGFYARSGGGLTLSGGEPLSQARFVIRLLKAAQRRGIDTAIETTGLCTWKDLKEACRYVNQVFFDIKSLNPEKHATGAGVDNQRILENFQKLCESFPELSIIVRTPVIPGFNDSPEDIKAIVDFVHRFGPSSNYELLPYHGFGEPKYRQLGMEYSLSDLKPLREEHMATLRQVVESGGSSVGSRTRA